MGLTAVQRAQRRRDEQIAARLWRESTEAHPDDLHEAVEHYRSLIEPMPRGHEDR